MNQTKNSEFFDLQSAASSLLDLLLAGEFDDVIFGRDAVPPHAIVEENAKLSNSDSKFKEAFEASLNSAYLEIERLLNRSFSDRPFYVALELEAHYGLPNSKDFLVSTISRDVTRRSSLDEGQTQDIGFDPTLIALEGLWRMRKRFNDPGPETIHRLFYAVAQSQRYSTKSRAFAFVKCYVQREQVTASVIELVSLFRDREQLLEAALDEAIRDPQTLLQAPDRVNFSDLRAAFSDIFIDDIAISRAVLAKVAAEDYQSLASSSHEHQVGIAR